MEIATKPNQWTVAEIKGDWVRLQAALYENQDPFPRKGQVLETPAKADRVKS